MSGTSFVEVENSLVVGNLRTIVVVVGIVVRVVVSFLVGMMMVVVLVLVFERVSRRGRLRRWSTRK